MTRADMGCWRCVWNDAEGFCGIWLLKTHGTLRDLHCSSLLVTSSQFIYSWAHVTTFVHPDRYTSILRELRGRRIFAQNERSGPIFTLSEFLTQFGRIRQLVVGECLESDARIMLRGNLCLPNFLVWKQHGRLHCGWNANDGSDFATEYRKSLQVCKICSFVE